MPCALPRIIVLDDPLTPEEHLNLGVTYENKGELDNALKEYHTASKKLPLAYLYIGNIHFQKDELEKRNPTIRKRSKKTRKTPMPIITLHGFTIQKEENLDEAERLVVKAIELNPSKRDIYEDTLKKIRELKARLNIK